MKSVLSVQSHVAHGYVGGRAATFPLQYLGWDVDNINTVNFSNHTGYGKFAGTKLAVSEMTALFDGLRDIDCKYDAVISGYVPNCELIDVLADNLVQMKTSNPDLVYICDTVMGDQGHLYVDQSCVGAYKKLLSRGIVDIITPNQYELELIYGEKVDSLESLNAALSYIHTEYSVKHVVVTSICGPFLPEETALHCTVSSKGSSNIQSFQIPEIKSYFTGVGDLFTALLLDKFYNNQKNITRAVNQVLTIMSDVLKLTHKAALEEYCRHEQIEYVAGETENLLSGKINDGSTMRFFELRVIAAREYYLYAGDGEFEMLTLK